MSSAFTASTTDCRSSPTWDSEWTTHEKGTGPFCRNGPEGALHKRVLSPFRETRNRLDALPDHHDDAADDNDHLYDHDDNHHVLSGSGRIQVRQSCLHRRSVDDRLRMFRGNARRSEPAVYPGRRIVLWVRRGYVCLRDLRNDNDHDQHHDNQHDDNDHALPVDQLPLHLVRNGLEPRVKLRG